MTPQIEILLDKIKALEIELIEELQKQEKEFSSEMVDSTPKYNPSAHAASCNVSEKKIPYEVF